MLGRRAIWTLGCGGAGVEPDVVAYRARPRGIFIELNVAASNVGQGIGHTARDDPPEAKVTSDLELRRCGSESGANAASHIWLPTQK
jgi:hypothetical protein